MPMQSGLQIGLAQNLPSATSQKSFGIVNDEGS